MSTVVREILDRIRSLPVDDRLELEAELAASAEAEWQAEVLRARESAKSSMLTQETIDRAVDEARYGQ